jgi:hypothetical protein
LLLINKTSLSVIPKEQEIPGPSDQETKTTHAEITLKSATLPRRKPAKSEIQVEIPPVVSHKIAFLYLGPLIDSIKSRTRFFLCKVN